MAKHRADRPNSENTARRTSIITGVAAIRPQFIRLPDVGGRCPYTGLSRSALVNLCVPNKANSYRPKVRSVRLTKPNARAKRGARLIDYESLIAYINGCESKAA